MGRAVSARAFALADSLSLEEPSAVGNGEIDLTTPETLVVPEHVQAAAAAALDRGETHYTTRPGVIPLREAIAQRLTADGFPASVETVLVTNGGAEALYIALQMLLAPSRRMVVAGPVPANVVAMIRFIGAEPVLLPTSVESRFYPSADAVTAAEGSSLLLSSPSPVTGLALSPGKMEAMIAMAIDRGMTVVLDRSLATALYDPALARFSNSEARGQSGHDRLLLRRVRACRLARWLAIGATEDDEAIPRAEAGDVNLHDRRVAVRRLVSPRRTGGLGRIAPRGIHTPS